MIIFFLTADEGTADKQQYFNIYSTLGNQLSNLKTASIGGSNPLDSSIATGNLQGIAGMYDIVTLLNLLYDK